MSVANGTYDPEDYDRARATGRPLVTIDVNRKFVASGPLRDTSRVTFQACLSPEQAERVLVFLRNLAQECLPDMALVNVSIKVNGSSVS